MLCGSLRPEITGSVGAKAATELSGLVFSRTQHGVLWTHNDSGDRARLLALRTNGRLLADVDVPGAQNVDWEDIAAGRGVLFAGDIGDNLGRRPSISVYRISEPQVAPGSAAATVSARRIELRYPDGPRDAEALLLDSASGALVIVEKRFDGPAGVYVAAKPSARAPATLRRAGRLSPAVGRGVTAGSVSGDGRTVALRTYDRVYVWIRKSSESIATALQSPPCVAGEGLIAEGQGEAMALSATGDAFYTVPEGTNAAIRRYAPR